MSWTLLLVLSALSACSKAQLVVTQSPSASVPPGGTATILIMMWTLGFILLMTYTSCSSSQPVLVQPPSVVTSPAQNVKIPCTLSSGGNFDIYRVLWIQQLLGKAPRLAYHFRIGSTQGTGPGVPNRFSVSADAGTRLWNLVITGVQVDDEADYYCATYFDGTFG
ncbi:hypothetical protein NDU88_006790 [Pleurodeles waltl]|uniref:Ig-like domain-containing protein n=1 Tax=Pleurodeles waltl TaxID=8319 RepID=A0AAV7LTM0_PLEWA|nr:hypothetical protein NDU88_006790 [Pleurodeles waltl]